MKKSILLISPHEDVCEFLVQTCFDLPVRVVHTTECHTGTIAARSSKPAMIFIDATDSLSHNGWVMARLIKMDEQLMDIPVVILSDAHNADELARKSLAYCQLPRRFPIPYARTLIEQSLNNDSEQGKTILLEFSGNLL